MAEQESVTRALTIVREAGYVALKEKSYHQAQERQRVAEARRRFAEEQMERQQRWVESEHAEHRRILDRLTFVYGVARAHGATEQELAGETGLRREPLLHEPPVGTDVTCSVGGDGRCRRASHYRRGGVGEVAS